MADPIRIALVGAGAFGRKHISVIAAVPGFVLAGIADPSPAAPGLAAAHGVPWFAEAGAMLDAVRPDGAIVVTPNHLHLPHGLLCIQRGVPTIIEKPVADTPEGGEQLAVAAEKADVPIMVGHHRRHNPIMEAARDLVHEVDALRFVVGDIVSLRAMTANAMRGFPVEDTVAIIVRFANGALGTVIVSDVAESPWSWELTSGENPMYPRQPAGNGMIAGTEGSLSLPHLDLWRHVDQPGTERGWEAPMQRARVPVATDDAYHRQLRHFGRVIRREEPPRVTARDAARSLAVCLAVYESARTGQEVAV
jgi:predicted dehydrogenase